MYRKKTKLLIIIPSLLISLSLFAFSAMAYVDYKYNPVSSQVQQKSLWCWAAVASMLANYAGASGPIQPSIVTYIYGSPINNIGTVNDMKDALANWNVSSTAMLYPISFGNIINNIKSNANMAAAIGWKNGGIGHMFAIRGYYEDTGNSKQTVHYIDPADGGYYSLSYDSFKNNDEWEWTNSLKVN